PLAASAAHRPRYAARRHRAPRAARRPRAMQRQQSRSRALARRATNDALLPTETTRHRDLIPEPLPRSFYEKPVLVVARACIGKLLVHVTKEGTLAGRIVECEAYRGPEDLAAHSARGRRTTRTEVMFGPPGHAYIFLLYGMHWAFNIVTGP